MSKQPKVTIIVPVYNVENYLHECIDSLINQSLKEIEIILVNDGSTDNSLEICREYENKDNRIKLINKKNEGVSIARNYGLKLASGEYITFCDSDDYVESDMYETMYELSKNGKIDLIICGIFLDFKGKKSVQLNLPYQEGYINNKYDFINKIFKVNFLNPKHLVTIWHMFFKRDIIEKFNLKFEIKLIEDYAFILQFCNHVDSCYYLNKPFYHYRIVNSSLSRQHNKRLFENLLEVQQIKEKGLNKLGLIDNEKVRISSACWFVTYAIKLIFFEFAFKNDSKLPEIIKRSRKIISNNKMQECAFLICGSAYQIDFRIKIISKLITLKHVKLLTFAALFLGKIYRFKKLMN